MPLDGERHDLATAVRSVLINVRQHAAASRVVVHAEEWEDAEGWTVTVHDDGRGFEPAATTLGVGLRELGIDQLARHAIDTRIESHPGLGTTVTFATRKDS